MFVKVLSLLSALCILGAGYFALDLFTGAPEIGEVIVLPIYIGVALILGGVFALSALLTWYSGSKRVK